jgi:hypothetical protein
VYRIERRKQRRRGGSRTLLGLSIVGPHTSPHVSAALLALVACSTRLDPTFEPAGSAGSGGTSECQELETTESRYWVCSAPLVSFEAARDDCRARGAELASVESQAENDFLAASTEGLSTHSNLWLGGSRDDQHVWTWPDGRVFWRGRADGTAPPEAYANWKAGEPNDSSTVSTEPERCAVLTLFDTRWNDRACSIGLSYFCELALTP